MASAGPRGVQFLAQPAAEQAGELLVGRRAPVYGPLTLLPAFAGLAALVPMWRKAADGRAVLRHGHREEVRLVEDFSDQRAAILRRYLEVAPGARPHFPVDRHAPLQEFGRIADRYPVFRITAADPGVATS